MKITKYRLAWVLGPPGAGKSTFAHKIQHSYSRVVEFDQLLSPLVDDYNISKGIFSANNHLIDVVRSIELHPSNLHFPPLLIIAGLIDFKHLLPISNLEGIFIILPERKRWLKQLKNRPSIKGNKLFTEEKLTNLPFVEKAYDELKSFLETNQSSNITPLDIDYQEGYIGTTFHKKMKQ